MPFRPFPLPVAFRRWSSRSSRPRRSAPGCLTAWKRPAGMRDRSCTASIRRIRWRRRGGPCGGCRWRAVHGGRIAPRPCVLPRDGGHRRLALDNLGPRFRRARRREPRHRARHVRALRPAADRCCEVRHAVAASRCCALIEFEGDERVRAGARAGQGRAPLHRALRLLGAQRAGARAGAAADVGAGAAARQSAAARAARAGPHAHRQPRDLPAGRDPPGAARAGRERRRSPS